MNHRDKGNRSNERIFIGLGSNLGDRLTYLQRAIDAIDSEPDTKVVAASRVYKTEPVNMHDTASDFLNACIELRSDFSPTKLLEECLELEVLFGRTSKGQNKDRRIDLDLLLFGSRHLETDTLTVPHPRMHRRQFVLKPLRELAPEFVHPTLNKTVRALSRECSSRSFIEDYSDKKLSPCSQSRSK